MAVGVTHLTAGTLRWVWVRLRGQFKGKGLQRGKKGGQGQRESLEAVAWLALKMEEVPSQGHGQQG